MKPTLFLVNHRFVHVLPNTANNTMTYQEIMDFVMGGYYDSALKTMHVEPRISIMMYICRYIWTKCLEWIYDLLCFDKEDKESWMIVDFTKQFITDREITMPIYTETVFFWLEKYNQEWSLFHLIFGPIAALIMVHRLRQYFCNKNKKERVCFECVKNPLENGCPKCSTDLDFIILIKTVIEVSFGMIWRFFDKLFSIDLFEETDLK